MCRFLLFPILNYIHLFVYISFAIDVHNTVSLTSMKIREKYMHNFRFHNDILREVFFIAILLCKV